MTQDELEKLLRFVQQDLDDRSARFFRELNEVRELVRLNELTDIEAQRRIDGLERDFSALRAEVRQIARDIEKMNSTIESFSPKLDSFIDNLWRAFFVLLMIVAGLVGIKLW